MAKIDVTMVAIAIRTARAIQDDVCRSAQDGRPFDYSAAAFDKLKAEARSLKCQLEDFGFTVRDDHNGVALSFGGIRATCTGGIHGALKNWLNKAESKVAAA